MLGITQLLSKPLSSSSDGFSRALESTEMTGNPDQTNTGSYTLSNNNQTVAYTASGSNNAWGDVRILPNSGKYYWEVTYTAINLSGSGFNYVGLYAYDSNNTWMRDVGSNGTFAGGYVGIAYSGVGVADAADGYTRAHKPPNTYSDYHSVDTLSQGTIISWLLDSDTGVVKAYKNGVFLAGHTFTMDYRWAHVSIYSAGRSGNTATFNFDMNNMAYDYTTLT